MAALSVYEGLDPRYTDRWLFAAESAAIYEEIIFRGLLFGLVAWVALGLHLRPAQSLVLALIVSSIAFGAYHTGTIANVVIHAVAGLAFGLLYCWRGIGASTLAHLTVNACVFVVARYVAPLFV
jgi:membrane protease YdiL (CAAX protease family)